MSTRAQRKAEASARRTEWKIRWISVARPVPAESGARAIIEAVAHDCERLIREQPNHKSEIMRALDEFVNALAKHTADYLKEQSATNQPNP